MFGITALQNRITRLERQVRSQQAVIAALAARLGVEAETTDPWSTVDEEERQLATAGKKIQAIKHHRERTGSGLREAKDAIDAAGRA